MGEYNSLLGAFFSGKDGNSGYNAGFRQSRLAKLYQSQDPAEQEAAARQLASVDPESAGKWQNDMVLKSAQLITSLGKDNPVAQQAWQTRIKPQLAKSFGAQAASLPDVIDDNIFAYAQQIAGGSKGMPSDVQSIQWQLEQAGYKPGSPEYKRALDVNLGLQARPSSAAIAYKVIKGADGRERLIAVDPRTPGAMVMDGSNGSFDAPTTQAPTAPDPNYIATNLQQVLRDAGFDEQAARDVADAYHSKKSAEPKGQYTDGVNPLKPQDQARIPTQPSGAFVSRTPEEQAALTREAELRTDLGYKPQIAGAEAEARAGVDARYVPQLASAKVTAEEEAKRISQGISEAPKAIDTADQALAVIDKAINHPGRQYATGTSAVLPWDFAAGTAGKDFMAVQKQLEGKAFLQAFESLKGGGQITEVEGIKATQAMARLDRAQSEKEYLQALKDLRAIVVSAREKAIQKAGGSYVPSSLRAPSAGGQPVQIRNADDYNSLPAGPYIDPNGKLRVKK